MGVEMNTTFTKQIVMAHAAVTNCLTRWQRMSRKGGVVGTKT
jgi:hypothetical protein